MERSGVWDNDKRESGQSWRTSAGKCLIYRIGWEWRCAWREGRGWRLKVTLLSSISQSDLLLITVLTTYAYKSIGRVLRDLIFLLTGLLLRILCLQSAEIHSLADYYTIDQDQQGALW